MEKCILTGRLITDEQTVITEEGPIAILLWGRDPVKYDDYNFGLLPPKLVPQFRKALGRDPKPSMLEDGGKCLGAITIEENRPEEIDAVARELLAKSRAEFKSVMRK